MTQGDRITAKLSQGILRYIFLLIMLLYIVIVFVAIINDPQQAIQFFTKFDINKLANSVDYLEIFFLVIAMFYLFKVTSKSEKKRYSENIFYYYHGYHKIKKSIIHYNSIPSCSVQVELGQYDLHQIELIDNHEVYELPILINEQIKDILIQKFNISNGNDFNATTLAIKDISEDNGKFQLHFCQSDYFSYLATNMIPEYEILPNVSIRDYLEPVQVGKLNELNYSAAENHLGISALISIKYNGLNYYIIPKRSNNNTVFKGHLSPSVSGAANIYTCQYNESQEVTIENFFKNEIYEELYMLFKALEINDKAIITTIIKNLKFIGMSRELKRLGKPELFFCVNIDYEVNTECMDRLLNNISKEKERYFFKNFSAPKEKLFRFIGYKKSKTMVATFKQKCHYEINASMDSDEENSTYYLFEARCFENIVLYDDKKNVVTQENYDIKRDFSTNKERLQKLRKIIDKDIYYGIEIENEIYKISESLFVNIALANEANHL